MNERLERLTFWCQKVLPLVYEDSLSYYELLCKVVWYINQIIENQNAIRDLLGVQGSEINQLKRDVNFLKNELENVKNGQYISVYIDALSKWIDNNLIELVSRIAKFVFFSLNDDGYFVAYIPSSWNEIEFDTNENGNLILQY